MNQEKQVNRVKQVNEVNWVVEVFAGEVIVVVLPAVVGRGVVVGDVVVVVVSYQQKEKRFVKQSVIYPTSIFTPAYVSAANIFVK